MFHRESLLQYTSLMQCYFFKYLLEFLYNLAGFQSNIKEVQEQFPAKFSMFLWAKPQILQVLMLQYEDAKILPVWQTKSHNWIFFDVIL